MPHQHRHLHAERNVIDDVNSMIDEMETFNPFQPAAASNNEARGGKYPQLDDVYIWRMNVLLTYTDGLTIVHTVYKTASKTFAGEIAGYSTQGQAEQTPDSKPPPPAPKPTSSEEKPKAVSSHESTSSSEKSSSTLPTAIVRPDHSSSIATSLAKATGDPSTPIGGFPGSQTSTPSATSNPDGDASSGPSPGAKAGIAIGVLGGVLLLGLIGFFIFRRKRAQKDSENGMHEKLGNGHDAFSTTPVIAPRVSLRPVTQFLPNWNDMEGE